MEKMYSKILVAYDGSELSKKALEMAMQMAKSDKSVELCLVNVIEPLAIYDYEGMSTELWLKREEEAGKMMEQLMQSLSSVENPLEATTTQGYPGKRIIELAQECKSDLIVMGSRGLSGVKEFFLGSVSHYVAQHASCPVLIVK